MFNYTPKNNDLLQLLEAYKSLIPKIFWVFFALPFSLQIQIEMSTKVEYLNYKNKHKHRCIEVVADVHMRVTWLQCGRLTSR